MPVHCCVPLCKQRGVTDSDGSKICGHVFIGLSALRLGDLSTSGLYTTVDPAPLRRKCIVAIKRDDGPEFQVGKSAKV
nr:uncharacterized protein LOC119173015 [Rhipicephalus microplus]